MRIFCISIVAVLLIHIIIQLKMSFFTEPDLLFIDRIIFKFACGSTMMFTKCILRAVSQFFSSMHIWILYGLQATAFVNLCNDVLDMFNCLDVCRVEVVVYSSKIICTHSLVSSVATMDFRPDAFLLATQTLPIDSNLAIDL